MATQIRITMATGLTLPTWPQTPLVRLMVEMDFTATLVEAVENERNQNHCYCRAAGRRRAFAALWLSEAQDRCGQGRERHDR